MTDKGKRPDSTQRTISKLKSRFSFFRKGAASALARLMDPIAAPALCDALRDRSAGVRREAAFALRQIMNLCREAGAIPPSREALIGASLDYVALWCCRAVPRVVPALCEALKDVDAGVRREAAFTLGITKAPTATQPLIAALRDVNQQVRMCAALALGEIQDASGNAALFEALQREDLAVVSGAYAFFIAEGKPNTEPVLVKALKKHGQSLMAEDYVNSGNSHLEAAARKWASEHNWTAAPGTPSEDRIVRRTTWGGH